MLQVLTPIFSWPRLTDAFLALSFVVGFFLASAHHVASFLNVLLLFPLFVFDLYHDPQGLDSHPHTAAELFGTVNRPYKGYVSFQWVPNPKPRASLLTDRCLRQQVAVIC